MPDPAPPVAEPSVEAPVAAAEPAESAAASPVDSLAEAFRRHGAPSASKERPDRSARRASPAASEESAEAEPKSAEASKPDDDQTETAGAASDGPATGPSRRGAAAAIKERDAQIEAQNAQIADLRKQWETERSEKEQRDRDLRELTAKSEATKQSILERIGKDSDFERLQAARMKREWLTAEEDDQLDRMLEWRAVAADFWELTDAAYKRDRAAAIESRAERYGLDRKAALDADVGGLIDHVAERIESKLRDEHAAELKARDAAHAEKVSEMETELKGLRPLKAARVPAPTTGGASAPAGDLPADDASPHAWFAAGIRNGTHRRGGGASARRAS